MQRKAQMQQVFIYASAIIVIVATIYLGFSLIKNLTSTACEGQTVQFMDEVSKVIAQNSAYGSVNPKTRVSATCDAGKLCFVDITAIGNKQFNVLGTDTQAKGLISLVRQGVKTNVYLIGDKGAIPIGFDEKIIVGHDPSTTLTDADVASGRAYVCVEQSNGYQFSTNGYGRFVRVSP